MKWEGNPNIAQGGEIRKPYREYLERFKGEQPLATAPERSDRVMVIIDNRRRLPEIPLVIANFRHFLGPEWGFRWIAPNVDGEFGPKQFNAMLLDPAFWEQFYEEHILFFQRDTICCQSLDPKYLEYDFIGAPCGRISVKQTYGEPRPVTGETIFDMNGGLSLRKRSAMLEALNGRDVFDPSHSMPEDVFFTRYIREVVTVVHERRDNLPDFETACQFSLESEPFYRGMPFGVHGTDKPYHSDTLAQQIVDEAVRREWGESALAD